MADWADERAQFIVSHPPAVMEYGAEEQVLAAELRAAYERGVRASAEAAARVAAETRAKIGLLRPEHAEQRSYFGAEIVGAETAEGRILALLDKEGGGDG